MYWDSMNRIRDRDNISYWMWQSGDALILFLCYFFPQNSLKPESNIFAVRHLPLPCNMQGNYPGGALEYRCKKKKAAVGILGHFSLFWLCEI